MWGSDGVVAAWGACEVALGALAVALGASVPAAAVAPASEARLVGPWVELWFEGPGKARAKEEAKSMLAGILEFTGVSQVLGCCCGQDHGGKEVRGSVVPLPE